MPKLLIVTTVPTTLRAFLLPYADHFRGLGWRVDALANGAADCGVCRQHFDHVWDATWSRAPLSFQNLAAAPRQLRTLIARERYDIVHVHTPVAGFVTRWALRRLRHRTDLKVLYTAHGFHFHAHGTPSGNAAFHALESLAARWTDRLVVINREDEQSAWRMMPARDVRYVPGIGVDTGRYRPIATAARDQVRARLHVAPHQPLFTMVAEMIPRKRHTDLLHAFARLARPDAVLALAGAGPLNAELLDLADSLGIARQVRFLGWQDDVASLMASSEAVLLVSAQEGLPRSVMEAMAVGVPVIGSDIRGTRDLLADGHGYLYTVGDVDALADAMGRVLAQPLEAAAMAERAAAKIQGYDIRQLLARHEALYADVLVRPAIAPPPHPVRV